MPTLETAAGCAFPAQRLYVQLGHPGLHLDSRQTHRVDHAAELDKAAVAGALDDAPMGDALRWRDRSGRRRRPCSRCDKGGGSSVRAS